MPASPADAGQVSTALRRLRVALSVDGSAGGVTSAGPAAACISLRMNRNTESWKNPPGQSVALSGTSLCPGRFSKTAWVPLTGLV